MFDPIDLTQKIFDQNETFMFYSLTIHLSIMKVSVESDDESHPETTLLKLLYLVREAEFRLAKIVAHVLRFFLSNARVSSPRSAFSPLHPGRFGYRLYCTNGFGVTRTSVFTRPPPLARSHVNSVAAQKRREAPLTRKSIFLRQHLSVLKTHSFGRLFHGSSSTHTTSTYLYISGPPGSGKTTAANTIMNLLNKTFYSNENVVSSPQICQ